MKTTPIVLTEKQEKWLFLHYKHTKNEEIAQKLGISFRSVIRLARKRGLEKSPQFIKKCQRETAAAAKRSHELHGTYPPKGYKIPNCEQYRFKPGETPRQRIGAKREAERVRKAAATRAATWKLEKARAIWGLPRETKLHVTRQPRERVAMRAYLKKRGYLIDDEARIAYWTETTQRGPRIEKKQQPWYVFKDVNDRPENVNDVNATEVTEN